MNRLIRIVVFLALFVFGIVPFSSATNPAPTPNVATPAPAINPHRPPIETAVIEGVSPGKTTTAQLTRLWGDPNLETIKDGQIVRLYCIEPLNHIEVTLKADIVCSIVIQLDSPFPEEEVRASLYSELLRSKPVLIPDENGEIIGQIFPEKGVMFLFAPRRSPEQGFFVRQIGIEPVSAEPFVMRAEAVLYDQPMEARQDLVDAVRLNPNLAKSFWLLAQIDLLEGHVESALLYNEKAIELDEKRPAYHLTFVQTLIRMNRIGEAKQYLLETIELCDRFPHEKAKALMMLGDLNRTSRQADHELAYECHAEAIGLATTLINNSNPTVRLIAKDVLFEAHLATAKAIAWGRWDNKDEAIKKWIDRAKALARDPELLEAKRYSREYPFKIAATALTTLVAIPEKQDIDVYIDEVMKAGNRLIESTSDPILQAKYHWDTSIALYDAVQIFQLRRQFSSALQYGEIAAQYMEIGINGRNNNTDSYLLGRLYFRLGVIHAVGNGNHRAAIEWFDQARPIFEKLLPKIDDDSLGVFGETLVSMGVSYWETGQHEQAIRLTDNGLRQIDRGVRFNVVDEAALVIPYTNLAKMHHDLGNREQAAKYSKLAESISTDRGRVR